MLAELTAEMIEHYQAVMDGLVDVQKIGDGDARDLRMWLAKFRPATSTSPMPAQALRAGR
jgi:hypothetical protein